MQTRLLDHLHKNNIISKEQYGFQTGFTTENAAYRLINEVLNALNNKQIVGSIFCDPSKAFDCVNHDILISKIENYGIIGKGKELFQSYIKGRYQQVLIDNKTSHNTTVSNWAMIKHGVPQGSILGPILFHLYVGESNENLKFVIKNRNFAPLSCKLVSVL
jgi:hypothetical protein